MRIFLVILVSLLLGIGAALYADRTPDLKYHIDGLLERVLPAEADVDPISGFVPEDELAEFGLQTCFERDPEFVTTPPVWMSRAELGPNASARTAARPYPDLERFPGLVKIEQILSTGGSQRHHCAATRVAEHWFLTANHCVRMRGPSAQVVDMVIVAPAEDVMQPESVIVPISGAVCHSAWYSDTGKFDDDVALVYVEDVSDLSGVDIARTDAGEMPIQMTSGDEVYFAGWGKNGQNRFLQGGALTVRNVGETFIMADNSGEFAPCVGDSGGPLYLETDAGPRVVGVLSSVTMDACPPYDRAFYMRLKSFDVWMTRAMSICRQNGRFVCGRPPEEFG